MRCYPTNEPVVCTLYRLGVPLVWYRLIVCGFLIYSSVLMLGLYWHHIHT